MSSKQRLGLLAVAVVVAVGAFLIAKPGDDDDDDGGTPAAQTAPADASSTPTATAPAAPEPPPAEAVVIEVAEGKPVGGPQEITVKKGERIRFTVKSSDTTDEVHLHGYDVAKDLAPGSPVRFDIPATIEGIFEVELEEAKVPIAELKVEPA